MTAATPPTSKPHGDGGITLTKQTRKTRRLSREILGLLGLSAALTAVALSLMSFGALHLVDMYFRQLLPTYTENQLIAAQQWALNACVAAALVFFVVLLLFLLGRKLSYIAAITRGVEALQHRRMDHTVPVEGHNELTELARAVNYLSARELELRKKEELLHAEREQLIRTLSHDIRTPLTSILSYTEYLTNHPDCDAVQRQSYLALMDGKARQIRQLTDILLQGGSRHPEQFDDARLLFRQLADQMESELEDSFDFAADFSACPAFSGSFDVAELRRIFDNLTSNIVKYAAPDRPVTLHLSFHSGILTLTQRNAVRYGSTADGHHIGLLSIRRIAQHYGGTAETAEDNGTFTIQITFSDF